MEKSIRIFLFRVFVLFVGVWGGGKPALLMAQKQGQAEKPLTIYVVRHAEKDTADKINPVLSDLGEQRAKDLCKAFGQNRPQAIFSTNTRRTLQTGACLGLVPHLYEARQLPQLVNTITALENTSTVLVIGHSNTILETVEAFGVKRPLPQLDDADYDYLFVLRRQQGQWQLSVEQYGAAHRAARAKASTLQ